MKNNQTRAIIFKSIGLGDVSRIWNYFLSFPELQPFGVFTICFLVIL